MKPPLLCLLVLVSLVGSCFSGGAAEKVLARAKDFEITQTDLDAAFVSLRSTLAAQRKDVPEQQRAAIERQLVDKLVLTQILLRKANDEDRRSAKEKVDRILAAEKLKAKSPARFEAQLRAAGMAPDEFEKQILERAICELVLDRDLRPKLGVTPEKIRAFYDQNPGRFQIPERVRLRQVVFSLRNLAGAELGDAERTEKGALAKQILDRAQKGEGLEQLARLYSDDPPGRDRGGEYLFPVGRMLPEFERAILALKTNQISGIITTPGAFHIVQVLERMTTETTPFDEVSGKIQEALEMEATQALLPEIQKELFQAARVEFPDRK